VKILLRTLMYWATLLFVLMIPPPARAATRLKELVSLEGVRENQLIGYGLVVGLNGTGDRKQTVFSVQSLTNLLQQMGVSVPSTAIRVLNTAAVMVTASLPAFGQPGTHLDVTAAAIGDATIFRADCCCSRRSGCRRTGLCGRARCSRHWRIRRRKRREQPDRESSYCGPRPRRRFDRARVARCRAKWKTQAATSSA